MNFIEQINHLQKQTEDAKIEKIRLEERQKTLIEEKDKLLEELKIYEIKENDLEGEIVKIEEEIQKELSKCQELLK